MKIMTMITCCLLLSACATPVTMMKNPETGQVSRCGGERSGSIAGGLIGYDLQKKDAVSCVEQYYGEGFKIISTENY